MGETYTETVAEAFETVPFSILERIDVGETPGVGRFWGVFNELSVSSNGSTWVKHFPQPFTRVEAVRFQYPRTDRRG